MLNRIEFMRLDEKLHAIEAILHRFPQVNEVDRAFTFSRVEQHHPLQFICKGRNGGYMLELSLKFLKERVDYIDLMGCALYIQIIEQPIYPTSDWKCYRFTSLTGIEEVHESIPDLSDRRTSIACAG